MRAPAVPLITIDPFFSVWSPETTLNFAPTMHWTGKTNHILGSVKVDGKEYSFVGYHRNLAKFHQVSLKIDALSTTVVMENDAIVLTAVFTTPTLLDDYRLLTRPVSYLAVSYESKDGKAHDVTLKVLANESLCLDHIHQKSCKVVCVSRRTDLVTDNRYSAALLAETEHCLDKVLSVYTKYPCDTNCEEFL